jgi:nucleotide-binding universal stress UspA family protein
MYAILIIMALVTSFMTPPLLSWLAAGVERRPTEARRLERERILAQLPFTKEGAKLLVLAGGGAHAQLSAHLAAALGNHHDASITVFHASSGEPTPDDETQFNQNFALLKSIAELIGARNVYQRSGSADSVAEAIAKESERSYDAIFAGASPVENDYALGGDVLHHLVTSAQTPIVITRNVGSPVPFRHLLVPTTGAAFSRLGAIVAMLYAHATQAKVTAMYVRETPFVSIRSFLGPNHQRNEGVPIIESTQSLARELGVTLDTLIASGSRPEKAIVASAERGQFDLLILGVQLRPAEGRLFFGPKVEHILRNVRCALALVVTPELPART